MKEDSNEDVEAILIRLREVKVSRGFVPKVLIEEAARILSRSPGTVRRWIRDGSPQENEARAGFRLNDVQLRAYHECSGSARAAVKLLEKQGHGSIDVRTFQRGVNRLTAYQKNYAKKGPKGARQHRLYLERQEAGRMMCLEGDSTLANVQVLLPRGRGKLVRPWVIAFIDTFSRAIVGICISLSPTQSDIAAALGSTFRRQPELTPGYGIPEMIRIDRGLDFTSGLVTGAATMLGTMVVHTPPYAPWKKGKIERFFRTMKDELFFDMPYYTEGPRALNGKLILRRNKQPMTYELFVSKTLEWVAYYNFKRSHSALGDVPPAEAWNNDSTIVREATEAELRRFLRRDRGKRAVKSRGVFVNKRWYTAAFLDERVETKVEVRDIPHDDRCVYIYDGNKFLGTAVPHVRLTASQKDQIRSIKANNARRSAKISAQITKDAKRRWAGSISEGTPEEISAIDPEDIKLLTDTASSNLANQIEERSRKRNSTKKTGSDSPKRRSKKSPKTPKGFFDGRDTNGGLK